MRLYEVASLGSKGGVPCDQPTQLGPAAFYEFSSVASTRLTQK